MAPTPYARNLDIVGHIGGMVSAVVAQGHYVYAGIGPELAVLDISIPERPTRVGYAVLPGLVKDIVVSGDYAYAIDGNLHIVDISDPTAPSLVGFLDTQNESQDIATTVVSSESGQIYVYIVDSRCDRGGQAYCDYYGRVRVVDVTNPAKPFESGHCDMATEVLDVAVADGIAYIASTEGLRMIDVSDPAAPTQTGLYETLERVIGVETSDGYAYVVVQGSGLQILDVVDSTQVGSYRFSTLCFGSAFENYHTLIARDTMYLLGCGSGGVRILDISDPTSPSEAGFYEMPLDRGEADLAITTGMAVVDPASITGNRAENALDNAEQVYAYIGNGSALSGRMGWTYGGISVVDVSDPAHPVRVGGYDAPGSVWDVGVTDSRVQGTAHACTAAYKDGLRVVDVSDPAHPRQVGAHGISEATDVLVTGNYAYLADQFCYFLWACQGSLRIIDFSDPAAPAEIGVYDPPGGFRHLVVAGNYIYAFNEDKVLYDGGMEDPPNGASAGEVPPGYTLRIVDVSTPAAPVERVSHDLQRLSVWDIGMTHSYLYFATADFHTDSGEELFILRLADPTHLSRFFLSDILGDDTEMAGTPTPRTPDLGSHDEYAYIYQDGYHVIDISNPAAPVKVGSSRVNGHGRRDAMDGRHAYRFDHQGLWVVDVSEPTNPTIAGFYLMPWYPAALDLGYTVSPGPQQPLIYVADELGGLYILRFAPPVE